MEAALNESPSEKEGKFSVTRTVNQQMMTLNESPSEKEGKFASPPVGQNLIRPSMKVPPKRKGNGCPSCLVAGESHPQ